MGPPINAEFVGTLLEIACAKTLESAHAIALEALLALGINIPRDHAASSDTTCIGTGCCLSAD